MWRILLRLANMDHFSICSSCFFFLMLLFSFEKGRCLSTQGVCCVSCELTQESTDRVRCSVKYCSLVYNSNMFYLHSPWMRWTCWMKLWVWQQGDLHTQAATGPGGLRDVLGMPVATSALGLMLKDVVNILSLLLEESRRRLVAAKHWQPAGDSYFSSIRRGNIWVRVMSHVRLAGWLLSWCIWP